MAEHSDENQIDIFIVEDDKDMINAYISLMDKYGFSFEVFENSTDALEALKIHRPKLLILDVELPDFNGDQLLTKISTELIWDEMIIYIVSGAKIEGGLDMLTSLGATKVFHKPIEFNAFFEEVSATLKMTQSKAS
jgi:DNA-binding NtrC family response regulator